MKTATERFWSKVEQVGECAEWRGSQTGQGYGRFHFNGRLVQAHRWAYEEAYGPIAQGLHLDHLCCNPSCVNPKHLEPVTNHENAKRGAALVTHCPRGHEYTPSNTSVQVRGNGTSRKCKECHRLRQRKSSLLADPGDAWEFTVLEAHHLEPGDVIRMTGPNSYDVIRPSDTADNTTDRT